MSRRYIKCIADGCDYEECASSFDDTHLATNPTHRLIQCWGGQ